MKGEGKGDAWEPEVIRRRSPRIFNWFTWYSRRFLEKNFHAVRLLRGAEPEVTTGRPLVIFCNHPSWHDPLILLFLARRYFSDRKHYGPIDEEALGGYGFFRRIGFFGVKRNSLSGARTFLRTAEAVLRRKNAVLWITAQGHFTDARARPVRLESGLGTAVSRCGGGDLFVLPLAMELAFGEERYPEIFLAFGNPVALGPDAENEPESWTAACESALEETQDRLGEAVISRDPKKFEDLAGGAVGVGGIYGLWKRFKSWFAGKKYNPRHGSLKSE